MTYGHLNRMAQAKAREEVKDTAQRQGMKLPLSYGVLIQLCQ